MKRIAKWSGITLAAAVALSLAFPSARKAYAGAGDLVFGILGKALPVDANGNSWGTVVAGSASDGTARALSTDANGIVRVSLAGSPSSGSNQFSSWLFSGSFTTPTTIKNSPGQVFSIHALNTTAAVAYFELWCKVAGLVTLGITNPDAMFGIPASGVIDVYFPLPTGGGTCTSGGLSVAGVTTPGGGATASIVATITYL